MSPETKASGKQDTRGLTILTKLSSSISFAGVRRSYSSSDHVSCAHCTQRAEADSSHGSGSAAYSNRIQTELQMLMEKTRKEKYGCVKRRNGGWQRKRDKE
eukprot:2389217-Rhodomonas_salina.1